MTKEQNKAIDRVKKYISYLEYKREIEKYEKFVISSIDRFNLTTNNIEEKSKEHHILQIVENIDSTITYIEYEKQNMKLHKDAGTLLSMNKILLNKP